MKKDLSEIMHCDISADKLLQYLPNYYKSRGIDKIDEPTRQHLESVCNWIAGNGKQGLMLMGSVGNGKTTMGRAVLSFLCYRMQDTFKNTGYDARTEFAFDTAKEITLKAMNDYPKTIFEYSGKKCTMVDDWGEEQREINVFGNKMTPVRDIIERVYEQEHALILTTNLDAGMIREKYGERVFDRLKETMHIVTFTNQSYR